MVGPLHFRHAHGAGGRQHAHPHPRRQNQNRDRKPPPDRTPTASNLRHFGQRADVGTFGFDRGTRPNGQRMRTTAVSSGAVRPHPRVNRKVRACLVRWDCTTNPCPRMNPCSAAMTRPMPDPNGM